MCSEDDLMRGTTACFHDHNGVGTPPWLEVGLGLGLGLELGLGLGLGLVSGSGARSLRGLARAAFKTSILNRKTTLSLHFKGLQIR